MGEERRNMAKNFHLRFKQRFWGFRPWERHGVILMVFGILFVLVGVNYIFPKPSPSREAALKALLQLAPIQFWGALFAIAGILCILSSRWPPFSVTWGYMVLTGLGTGWAATYLMGILFYHSPAVNVSQVLLWSGLSFAWWAISGLPNPPRPEK